MIDKQYKKILNKLISNIQKTPYNKDLLIELSRYSEEHSLYIFSRLEHFNHRLILLDSSILKYKKVTDYFLSIKSKNRRKHIVKKILKDSMNTSIYQVYNKARKIVDDFSTYSLIDLIENNMIIQFEKRIHLVGWKINSPTFYNDNYNGEKIIDLFIKYPQIRKSLLKYLNVLFSSNKVIDIILQDKKLYENEIKYAYSQSRTRITKKNFDNFDRIIGEFKIPPNNMIYIHDLLKIINEEKFLKSNIFKSIFNIERYITDLNEKKYGFSNTIFTDLYEKHKEYTLYNLDIDYLIDKININNLFNCGKDFYNSFIKDKIYKKLLKDPVSIDTFVFEDSKIKISDYKMKKLLKKDNSIFTLFELFENNNYQKKILKISKNKNYSCYDAKNIEKIEKEILTLI